MTFPNPYLVRGPAADSPAGPPTERFEVPIPLMVPPGRKVPGRVPELVPPLSANWRLHWAQRAERSRVVREAVVTALAGRTYSANVTHTLGTRYHVVAYLTYVPQDDRRRDPSNLMPTQKAAIDGLVEAGVVPDDSPRWVTERVPVIVPGRVPGAIRPPRVLVLVVEAWGR